MPTLTHDRVLCTCPHFRNPLPVHFRPPIFKISTLRRDPFWVVRKNLTSKELYRRDDSIPYLDNAELFYFRTIQNGSRLRWASKIKIEAHNDSLPMFTVTAIYFMDTLLYILPWPWSFSWFWFRCSSDFWIGFCIDFCIQWNNFIFQSRRFFL